jgi:hypothetical protein
VCGTLKVHCTVFGAGWLRAIDSAQAGPPFKTDDPEPPQPGGWLKEHRTVQELKSTVAKQEATILQQQKDFQATATHQQKQIEALTAGLQKVSAQLEASKPAPQVVNNP